MGLERYVVDAVLIEKRSPTEIAKAHGMSRSWLYELIARVRGGGYTSASEPLIGTNASTSSWLALRSGS
jgi:transposase